MSHFISNVAPNTAMYPTSAANVHRFILQETGTYNTMQSRPFMSDLTPHALNRVTEATRSGMGNNYMTVIPHVAMMITPSLQSHGEAYIPNGWQTRRMRFSLTVETRSNMNMMVVETITGYTEYSDLSMSGYVDPNMAFYINSVVQERRTHQGLGYLDAATIIPGNAADAATQYRAPVLRQRPQDVIARIDNSIYLDNDLQRPTTVDLRFQHTAIPIKSRREEQSAPAFISNIVKATSAARAGQANNMMDQDEAYKSLSAQLQNAPVNNGGFMYALSQLGHYATNVFTLGMLMELDPMAASKMVVLPMTDELRSTQHQVGMTSFFEQPCEEVVVATIIAQSMPAIMARTGFVRVALQMDNMTHSIFDARYCAPNADIAMIGRQMEAFILAMRTEVIPYVTHGNEVAIMISVEADLNGDVVVGVALGSGGMIQYVFPSYCDSLITPVLTRNETANMRLAADVQSLVDNIVHI